MERFRRRRAHSRVSSPAKVTTIVNQSSENWVITTSHLKGNQLLGKNTKLPKSTSHSSNCSSIVNLEENQLSFELGRGSGIPMKKLLADEMAKETDSGRRSPSIIARLMGLDGLPASHSTNKKQKRLSDSHQRGSSSTGISKNSKHHDGRSHRKTAMGQQHFKDVYEVVDRSNLETRSTASLALSSENFSENEIGFIREKFMEAQRFSTDENYRHSKEFQDTIEVLFSNKDLLLRFLQERDSLFLKHLHDLRNAPESYNGCILDKNSKNVLKCNIDIDVMGCPTRGEASQKIDISQSYKHHSSYSNMYDRHSTDLHKLSLSAEGIENASSIPTKIVVLKPNLGKALNLTKSASSTTSCEPQSDFELYNKCLSLKYPTSEVKGKRGKYEDSDNYGRKSQESRELAREITSRMKSKLGVDSFNVPSYKGYSADESSHDTSENDSSYESEVTFLSSRTSSTRTVRGKSSSLRYFESSVNLEGKKRLSERWKLTHMSPELGESSKGGTLAEMLAIPDVDIRPRSPDITVRDECFCRFERNDEIAELNTPLGISSRDGWKDGCIQNLSRSKSLPTSVNHLGSPKSCTKREAIASERFLIRKGNFSTGRNKAIRRESKRKDGCFSESRKPSDELSQSPCPVKMADEIYEVQSSGNMIKNTTDGKDSPEVKTVILELPSCRHDTCLPLNGEVFARDISSCVLSQDGSSTSDMPSLPQVGVSSGLQCTATHLETPASGKEAEQPSPVSVLEAPFVEDLSSGSECFERVSADLHGLRMQLQLLKRESEDYDEGSLVISSDEYADESTELCDDKNSPRVGGCWKSWYLVDVLALSGFDKIDGELFLDAWNSSDCPIGAWVFNDLEKRYNELESCLKSERKLLFDLINARIMEISQPFLNVEPWVKKPEKSKDSHWLKDVLENELHNLLGKYENKATENDLDKMILSNMRWMALGEHISSVGRHIEALLIDELVTETLHV